VHALALPIDLIGRGAQPSQHGLGEGQRRMIDRIATATSASMAEDGSTPRSSARLARMKENSPI
jgi:hypothetical protein